MSKLQLNEYQTQKMMKLMAAVNDLEQIGDVIEISLVDLGEKRIKKAFKISKAAGEGHQHRSCCCIGCTKASVRAVVEGRQ